MKLFLGILLVFSNGFFNAPNDGDLITIVQKRMNRANTIWYQDKLNLNYDFDMSFEINLGKKDSIGDGATFILSSSNKEPEKLIGGSGGLIGALDIPDSLVLEFDTFFNVGRPTEATSDSDLLFVEWLVNGHLGIIETNNMENKHKESQSKRNEFLRDGNFRNVDVSWDAKSSTISFLVEGFDMMSHQVNIEETFSGESEVMFGYSSVNGLFINDAQVKTNVFPHQIEILHAETQEAGSFKNMSFNLSKVIRHDKRGYGKLEIKSNDNIVSPIFINGVEVDLINNQVDLRDFDDKNLRIDYTVKKNINEKSTHDLMYADYVFSHEEYWPKDQDEIEPPQEPSIPLTPLEPGTVPNPPLTPLEPGSVPNPPLTPIEPSEDIPVEEDILPIGPNDPNKSKPQPPVDSNVKSNTDASTLTPATSPDSIVFKHSLVQEKKSQGPGNIVSNNPIKTPYYRFNSGSHGVFLGETKELKINVLDFTAIPEPIPQNGFKFIGYIDQNGNYLTVDNFSNEDIYTAVYHKINNIQSLSKDILTTDTTIYISLFLVLFRYVLNRDIIRRRKISYD